MKRFFDALFLGTIAMAPKAAVIIILFGCLAAIGEQNGLSKAAYTSVGAFGLVLGIVAVIYNVQAEKK
ncbi:hypothetical protein [Hymenobacter siberiensis]|uniref:hypothetical protein n=1 Tax=Hymenobacter siberiensis TaxID=2848396 RepID=UPI001C1E3B5D|nr:hypothetical protein [Hymenobacter siberiensis]